MNERRGELLHALERAKLYAIVDLGYVKRESAMHVARALLAGGAGVIQLRAKGQEISDVRDLAHDLQPLCRAAGVPFIVNDHVDIAAEIGADGVHLGQDDGDLAEARARLRPGGLVGRSTHAPAQAAHALAEGADYIGFGPLFPTPTKPGRPAIGLQDIAAVEKSTSCPVFCIGGVNPETLPQVLLAGARRVVIVSALLKAENTEFATRRVVEVLGKHN